jgi:hypothetical protein
MIHQQKFLRNTLSGKPRRRVVLFDFLPVLFKSALMQKSHGGIAAPTLVLLCGLVLAGVLAVVYFAGGFVSDETALTKKMEPDPGSSANAAGAPFSAPISQPRVPATITEPEVKFEPSQSSIPANLGGPSAVIASAELFVPSGGPNQNRNRQPQASGTGRALASGNDGRPVVRPSGISIDRVDMASTPAGGSDVPPGGVAISSGGLASSGVVTGPVPGSAQGGVDLEIPVPVGAIVPAAFYDDQTRSPQQAKALAKIANEFQKNIASSTQSSSTTQGAPNLNFKDPSSDWETARQIADHQYLILFGYQAYNQAHLSAAKDALQERRQLQTEQASSTQ